MARYSVSQVGSQSSQCQHISAYRLGHWHRHSTLSSLISPNTSISIRPRITLVCWLPSPPSSYSVIFCEKLSARRPRVSTVM